MANSSPKTCSVEGCPNLSDRRGMCWKHYGRWERHGSPTVMKAGLHDTPLEAKLYWGGKLDKETDCFEWTLSLSAGYGSVSIGAGKQERTHRAMWACVNGPIPKGMEICHKCDNKKCYNLAHLFLGTHRDNMRDAGRKGRIRHTEETKQRMRDIALIREARKRSARATV